MKQTEVFAVVQCGWPTALYGTRALAKEHARQVREKLKLGFRELQKDGWYDPDLLWTESDEYRDRPSIERKEVRWTVKI